MRRQWLVGVLLVAAALVTGCRPAPASRGRIDMLDVRATVEPDGDLAVVETIRIVPDASGRVGLDRLIDSEFADATTLVRAVVDGGIVEEAGGGLSVVSTADGGLFVSVAPPGERTVPAAIELAYVLERAVAVNEPRARVEWSALAPGHGHSIDRMRMALELPEGGRFHEGTGVGQPGWTVTIDGPRLEATRAPVGAGEAATLLAVFDLDRSRMLQGDWEWNRDRREQYVYALVSAGAFIVVIGLGVLIVLRLQYPPLHRVPGDRRPALAADRRMVAAGLRTTAIVSLVFAALLAAAGAWWLGELGAMIYAIPGSMALVAVILLVAGWVYRKGSTAPGPAGNGPEG